MSKTVEAERKNKVRIIVTDPKNLSDDHVVVKTLASGVSIGTERKTLSGKVPSFLKHWDKSLRIFTNTGERKHFPTSLGYSLVGRIIKIGKSVKKVKIGDLVWLDKPHSDYNIVSEEEVVKSLLPKDIDPNIAVFLPFIRIALGAVHDANLKVGDFVVIVGLGLIGNLVAQIAKISGVKVLGFDINEFKVKKAEEMGLEAFSNNKKDIAKLVREKYSLKGADAAIETSGTYSGLKEAIRSCGITGLVVTVGSYNTENFSFNFGEEWQKNKIRMTASMTVNDCPHPNYPLWDLERLNKTALDLLYQKKVVVESLITQIYDFEEVRLAYKTLLSNKNTQGIVLTYK